MVTNGVTEHLGVMGTNDNKESNFSTMLVPNFEVD